MQSRPQRDSGAIAISTKSISRKEMRIGSNTEEE